MFRQITLLYMSAVLHAAHEHSPAWVAYRKNVIHLGIPPKPNEMKHQAGHSGQVEYKRLQESVPYPGQSGAVERRRSGISKKVRNALTKSGGRELFGDLTSSLVDGLRDTTKLTTDLVKGSAKLTTDLLKKAAHLGIGVIEHTKKAVDWMTTLTVKIGKLVVTAPLQGIEVTVNAAWAAHTLGTGLAAQMISDTADWFQWNWKAVKAVEFPGKHLIVLLYPSGPMSVVNSLTKEIMYVIDKGHKALTHAFACTLYVSLKIVFDSVDAVLKFSHLDCVKLVPQKVKVNDHLIETISTESGKACGISHLKPVNNVTITRNDEKFLIVKTPWVLEDLYVNMTGVEVAGVIGTVLDNEVMETNIRRMKATGTVFFEAGTLLRFVGIHMEVESIEGLSVNFPAEEKSRWMESIETLSDRLSSLVTEELNHVFGKIEKKVFDYIARI